MKTSLNPQPNSRNHVLKSLNHSSAKKRNDTFMNLLVLTISVTIVATVKLGL